MNSLTDFAAIDFETANSNRSSICSVGIAIVHNEEIAEEIYKLICPTPNFYTLSWVHGLTRDDTDSVPIFPEVWKEISERIDGLPLVAHNSSFDESCLRCAFEMYDMNYPEYEFHCTYRAANEYFRGLPKTIRPERSTLDCVSDFFGVYLGNHHNAIADARACAEIALKLQLQNV